LSCVLTVSLSSCTSWLLIISLVGQIVILVFNCSALETLLVRNYIVIQFIVLLTSVNITILLSLGLNVSRRSCVLAVYSFDIKIVIKWFFVTVIISSNIFVSVWFSFGLRLDMFDIIVFVICFWSISSRENLFASIWLDNPFILWRQVVVYCWIYVCLLLLN